MPPVQEPNFHNTYVLLVARWGERPLRDTLVLTTMHYIRVMLGSSKLKSITSERTLLKNLGAWLGKLTLANNRPVLQVRTHARAAACGCACCPRWAGLRPEPCVLGAPALACLMCWLCLAA